MAKRSTSIRHAPRQWLRILRSRLARRSLKQTRIIAVTGSCGKTTASTLLIRLLSNHGSCFAGSISNDTNSVLRNLMAANPDHRYFVQEASGSAPGCLRASLSVLRPQIGIVTSVGLDHYVSFRNVEAVAVEKSTMVDMLPPDGCAVLSADDPHVAAMGLRSKARVITYGMSPTADLRAYDVDSVWPDRLAMTLAYQGRNIRLETRLFGKLLLPSVLAAIGGALAAGLELQDCVTALQGIDALPHRMSLHRSSTGSWLISDTFKATYWTVPHALDQLKDAKVERITAVLGSFSDVPGRDRKKYRHVAKYALNIAHRVIFIGPKARYVRDLVAPENEGRLFAFESIEDGSRLLVGTAVPNELILIKSARIDHLERLIYTYEQPIRCWITDCRLKDLDCRYCPKSGIAQTP